MTTWTAPAGIRADWQIPMPPTQEVRIGSTLVRCFVNRPSSIDAMVRSAVARHPDAIAYVCAGSRLTWRGADALIDRIASALQAADVRPGDRVAMLLSNRLEFPLVALAATRSGAVFVPMSTRMQTAEIAHCLNDCGAKLLVHESDASDRLPTAQSVPAILRRVAFGGSADDAESFERFIAGVAHSPPVHDFDERAAAAILYTSGTTGRPKGAVLTHLSMAHSAMHYEACLKLTAADRSVAAVPLSHVTGLVAMMTTMLHCAGTLVIMPSFSAEAFVQVAIDERITHTILVPAMYKLCLLRTRLDARALAQWRIGGYGGAPMPPVLIEELAAQLPGLNLVNSYGATETTGPTTVMPLGTRDRTDTVGRLVPCGNVRVVDPLTHADVPDGDTGELWISGPMVVREYWGNAAATRDGFVDGWWRSGDVASVDAEGFVKVVDRLKDVINRGGYKVFSAEVEAVLAQHPKVIEAAVVARECAVLGERVHAFVTVQDAVVTGEQLREHCASLLSDYKVPETFSVGITPLPRNVNGKVLKRELRQILPSHGAGEAARITLADTT